MRILRELEDSTKKMVGSQGSTERVGPGQGRSLHVGGGKIIKPERDTLKIKKHCEP